MKIKPIYILIAVLSAALVGGVVASSVHKPVTTSSTSQRLEDFDLTKLTGGRGKLSDYRGQVVLVNFWASWCGTCRDEMPDIIQTFNKYKDQGFNVLAVNYGEDEAPARQFVTSYGMNFPVFMDPGKVVAGRYQVLSMPTSFLLDRQGQIKEYGPGRIDTPKLQAAIEALLAASP